MTPAAAPGLIRLGVVAVPPGEGAGGRSIVGAGGGCGRDGGGTGSAVGDAEWRRFRNNDETLSAAVGHFTRKPPDGGAESSKASSAAMGTAAEEGDLGEGGLPELEDLQQFCNQISLKP